MSGGYFDYHQYRIDDIAESIQNIIGRNGSDEKFSDEIISEFKTAANLLRRAAIYAHRIDYLISGDDDEASFRDRLLEDLSELEEQTK